MEQYFTLMNEFSSGTLDSKASRSAFASTFLSDSAAIWWYTKVSNSNALNTWNKFIKCVKEEFVPGDYVQRARDKLRKWRQIGSVSRYLSELET